MKLRKKLQELGISKLNAAQLQELHIRPGCIVDENHKLKKSVAEAMRKQGIEPKHHLTFMCPREQKSNVRFTTEDSLIS